MSLMHALVEGDGKLNTFAIVKYYGIWYKDGPFDIGTTTRNALKHADPENPCPDLLRNAAH